MFTRISVAPLGLGISLLLFATCAHARPRCRGGRFTSACPPWTVCSVYVGDCQSSGMLQVCSGTCQPGGVNRFVPRLALSVSRDDRTHVGAALGLEWVPPLAAGHLSLRGESGTRGGARLGPMVAWPLAEPVLLGAGADVHYTDGDWGLGANLRVEYFPWHLAPSLQLLSVWVETGAAWFDSSTRREHVLVGLGVWI